MKLPSPLRWLGALLALYLIAPLLSVLPQLARADWSTLRQRALWQATEVSFASASLATLLIALGGIPLGYCLARHKGTASRILGFVMQLPLALPPLVAGVLLLFLLGPYTLLGGWAASAGLPLTDSFAGVVLAEVFVAAPFLIVAARSAFVAVDRDLEHVAATLGHGVTARFFKVSLPLAWPTIVAGLLLAWLRAIGEFGATVMVAYHPYSLPVFTFVSFGSQGLSAMLPILLPTLLSALIVVAAAGVVRRRHARVVRDAAAARSIRALADKQGTQSRTVRQTARSEIELDLQLRHRYRNFELDLQLRTRARRIAILGPSGSGKSLSLRLLAGLESGHRNAVVIDGIHIEAQLPEMRRIGYVPQNYALFPHLAVAEQLLFAPDAVPELAAYWARRFDLLPLLERLPAQLSLGQQQRVALARALARPSRLLLLDEPFAALDTPLRTRLRRALRTLQREFDGTTLIVTHDPQDAAELSDEIVVMDAGRVLQHGASHELFRRPGSVEIAGLLGVENVFDARVDEGGRVVVQASEGADLQIGADRIDLVVGTDCLVRIPAEAVRLHAQGEGEAIVEDRFEMPNRIRLVLRLGELRLECVDQNMQAIGGVVRFSIDAALVDIWQGAFADERMSVPAIVASSAVPLARAAVAASNTR